MRPSHLDNSHEPATKADLHDAISGLEARMSEMERGLNERHEMLRAEMHHSHDALV